MANRACNELTETYNRATGNHAVLVVDGYGVTLRMRSGALHIEDGIGAHRRTRTVSRADRTVRRIVVLADTGEVTLDAVRWCADLGITIVQIDRDARPLFVSGPDGRDDARIRRAQAAAASSPAGLTVARQLLTTKVRGQARVAKSQLNLPDVGDLLMRVADEIAEAPDLPRCQELEAKAANIYFATWGSRVEPRWAARDIDRIPAHWRTFSTRSTPLLAGKTPRNAADPINAMLNYGYTIAAVEARIAALTLGLDPGLGILNTDKRDRDSFALDLVETIRPHVDATVLQLISGRHFRRGDFHETRDGRVRLLAPLTHELAEYAPAWAAAIAPHAESAAHTIIDNAIGQIRRPTHSPARMSVPHRPLPTPVDPSAAPIKRNRPRRPVAPAERHFPPRAGSCASTVGRPTGDSSRPPAPRKVERSRLLGAWVSSVRVGSRLRGRWVSSEDRKGSATLPVSLDRAWASAAFLSMRVSSARGGRFSPWLWLLARRFRPRFAV